MLETQLQEWISPQEASLVMSVRRGIYVSPDDIKQLRNQGRFEDGTFINVSKRNTIYKRSMIERFEGPKKRSKEISKEGEERFIEVVARWLWEFPKTIQELENQGYTIPLKNAALLLVPRIEEKQANPKK